MKSVDDSGVFYLGREYDLHEHQMLEQPLQYDSKNLTTHGVVVGMTGSGKTGLCISMVEEAALQQVPSIIVDLKGDLSNLLLQFPQLRASDFAPWVDPDEARRSGKTIEEHAEDVATRWRQGLQDWGQGPDRIAKLQETAEWKLYTPGSEAGLPVSVVQNFAAPHDLHDREALIERVEATTTALLGLTNVSADPVKSREHILISNLLLAAWREGRDLDLPHLINEITHPPLRKIGTFDIDMFYPEDERMELALALNNLLASPSFSGWVSGEPLELETMLYTPEGKPRQLIFYMAHLDDTQRMFFLTLLLEEVLTWMRSQSGTTGLRALLYLDEMYGYLPPHPANPPTKRPLLTLLKQGRAYGMGVLLATQNPMDLDYKALTNAGSWFIGKLQTERDKARLVEGLDSIASEKGTLNHKSYLEKAISSLGNQVFLLHDVHREKPVLFHTRWALSYLYGPMSREHLTRLVHKDRESNGTTNGKTLPTRFAGPKTHCTTCHQTIPTQSQFCLYCGVKQAHHPTTPGTNGVMADGVGASSVATDAVAPSTVPPVLPPGLKQYFMPLKSEYSEDNPPEGAVWFEPRLLAFAEVMFEEKKHNLEHEQTYRLLCLPPDPAHPNTWENAEWISEELESEPTWEEAFWEDVPSSLNDPKKLKESEKEFLEFLHYHAYWTVYLNKPLGLMSREDEAQDAFEARCQEVERTEKKPNAKSQAGKIQEITITPRKADMRVTHFGLAWGPVLRHEAEERADQPLYASLKKMSAAAWDEGKILISDAKREEKSEGVGT